MNSNDVDEQFEQRKKAAAERKRKQREREKRLDMKPFQMRLARGERRMIAGNALARGYEDQTEYLFSLVLKDRGLLVDEGCDMSRFDESVSCDK